MHDNYPKITKLAVHLENQQNCYFNANQTSKDIPTILDRSGSTTLTAWFKYNREHPNDKIAQKLRYSDFTDHYTWNVAKKMWSPRIRNTKSIGRMHFVYPKEDERYYLRLLLTHVKGATSFNDLKTIKGKLYKTFKSAAIAYNLLESDEQLDKCLEEAQSFQSAKQFRHLFAMILLHCNITEPLKLWKKYKEQFCDDIMKKEKIKIKLSTNKTTNIPHQIQNIALTEIEILLNNGGKSLTDFNCFPKLTHIKKFSLIKAAQNYDINLLKKKSTRKYFSI